MKMPIGMEISEVTRTCMMVPMMAWAIPPPAELLACPAISNAHQSADSTTGSPLPTTVYSTHTSGARASAMRKYTAPVAKASFAFRPPEIVVNSRLFPVEPLFPDGVSFGSAVCTGDPAEAVASVIEIPSSLLLEVCNYLVRSSGGKRWFVLPR